MSFTSAPLKIRESRSEERKKRNVRAKNELDFVCRLADRTSFVLVCQVTLGSRARPFDRPKYEHFLSRLNTRQINR
jgi:hypothetical protein